MTENGDPLENAIAERVNCILKEVYLDHYQVVQFNEARKHLDKAVKLYNEQRPHMSISNNTPEKVHKESNLGIKKIWKSYYKN